MRFKRNHRDRGDIETENARRAVSGTHPKDRIALLGVSADRRIGRGR
jgi:hypothetical protein